MGKAADVPATGVRDRQARPAGQALQRTVLAREQALPAGCLFPDSRGWLGACQVGWRVHDALSQPVAALYPALVPR